MNEKRGQAVAYLDPMVALVELQTQFAAAGHDAHTLAVDQDLQSLLDLPYLDAWREAHEPAASEPEPTYERDRRTGDDCLHPELPGQVFGAHSLEKLPAIG